MPTWTVYCHTHVESGRRYVGVTKKTMLQRWNQHVYTANLEKAGWSHFANAIRKYGKDAFSHEVLETHDSLEKANEAEVRLIAVFDTRNPEKGFNFKRGGDHRPHSIKNPWDRPEFREKGLANLAKANALQTPEVRSANSRKLWQDLAFRESVTSGSQAVTRSPEFREAMSERVAIMWRDPALREKFEKAVRERAKDPALRDVASRRWDDPSYRERCSSGARAFSEAQRTATHCPKGHPRTVDDSTPSGWARECHVCANERRRLARTHCPKGHSYGESTVVSASGRRVCPVCLAAATGPRPCSKCGRSKSRRSGGRLRCGPCTDARVAAWRESRSA